MTENRAGGVYVYEDPGIWIYLGDEALQSRRYAEAESWYTKALAALPDECDLLNNLGTSLWFLGRLDAAEEHYRRAHEIHPSSHSSLNNLANIQRTLGRLDEAEANYRRALELLPSSIEATINLGVVLSDLGRLEESEDLLRRALEQRPGIPDVHLNLGTTLTRMGRPDEAISFYETAIRLRPVDFAEARRNRGMHLLSIGDFEQGWPEYEWRWRCFGKGLPTADRPLWNGEDLEGRSILLFAEQGFGDAIQFFRYTALVKKRGADVTLACRPPQMRLFRRSPWVDRLVPLDEVFQKTDYQLLLMSFPAVLNTRLDSIPANVPYLSADPEAVATWGSLLARSGDGLKIGIAWQGNPKHPEDARRSFPLSALAPLASVPGVRLIRLQHGHGSEQLERLNGMFKVEDPFSEAGLDDWDYLDAANLIENLDLVVTMDSSIAHLAGALGKPVWVALPFASEWRWLRERDDSPWYPSMRLFRQRRDGDWDEVFERMSDSLKEWRRLRPEAIVS